MDLPTAKSVADKFNLKIRNHGSSLSPSSSVQDLHDSTDPDNEGAWFADYEPFEDGRQSSVHLSKNYGEPTWRLFTKKNSVVKHVNQLRGSSKTATEMLEDETYS